MPFKSKAQRRWMYANDPEMAKKWEKETPKDSNLPEKKKKKEAWWAILKLALSRSNQG